MRSFFKAAQQQQQQDAPNVVPDPLLEAKWATMTCRRLRAAVEPLTKNDAVSGLRDSLQAGLVGSISPAGRGAERGFSVSSGGKRRRGEQERLAHQG